MNMINADINLVIMHRYGADRHDAELTSKSQRVYQEFVGRGIAVKNLRVMIAGDSAPLMDSKYQTIVVAIGGDGTFVSACREFAGENSLVVGIAGGSVNFLTSFSEISDLTGLFGGTHKVSHRVLGSSKVYYKTTDSFSDPVTFANDVVIAPCDHKMVNCMITDDQGRLLADFKGDGVLISTPMGTTAYSLSMGGPLMHPTMQALLVTPRAPRNMAARPIILPTHVGLRIHVDADCDLISDGLPDHALHEFTVLHVDRGPDVLVALPEDYSFFEQARQKLGWFK